jgi:RNA polymerase sigma-70 factor (ECF subfamily)
MRQTTLQRVAAGDPGSVQSCIDQFGGLIWSLARRLAPADAEDAVQEIFIDLWKSAGRYDAAVASEATFVAMIARRRLIDRRRRLARQPDQQPITDPNAPTDHEGDPATVDDAAVASRALAALSTDQQRVIRLAVYQGLSHDQISKATGLPLGTVKTHIRRGLIRVREMLERTSGHVRSGAGS